MTDEELIAKVIHCARAVLEDDAEVQQQIDYVEALARRGAATQWRPVNELEGATDIIARSPEYTGPIILELCGPNDLWCDWDGESHNPTPSRARNQVARSGQKLPRNHEAFRRPV